MQAVRARVVDKKKVRPPASQGALSQLQQDPRRAPLVPRSPPAPRDGPGRPGVPPPSFIEQKELVDQKLVLGVIQDLNGN